MYGHAELTNKLLIRTHLSARKNTNNLHCHRHITYVRFLDEILRSKRRMSTRAHG